MTVPFHLDKEVVMKTHTLLCAATALALLSTAGLTQAQDIVFAEDQDAEQMPAQSPVDADVPVPCAADCCCSSWSARVGTVYMTRESPDSVDLLLTTGGAASVVNASEYDFDFEAGVDVGLVYDDGCGSGWEVRYLWMDDWNDTILSAVNAPTIATNPITRISNQQTVSMPYESELQTIELNVRKCCCGVTLLAGFRYVDLNEELSINMLDGNAFTTDFQWRTQNDLYGFQLGAEGTLWDNCCGLRLEGVGKAGIYYNDSDAAYSHRNNFNSPTADAADSSSEVAFLGELGLYASYQVRCNLALRAGYQVMWIEGVALASEQVSTTLGPAFSPPGTINLNTGGVLYHGGFVGLEYRR